MTTGALIFAFNNEHTDYVALAAWSAERINRHLKIPVAVVTNDTEQAARYGRFDRIIAAEASTGGTRWFEDYQSSVTWHNAGRVDAYLLSPWQRTLVLDADYVVNSNDLESVLELDADFLCFRQAYNICDPDTAFLDAYGRFRMPMSWATVMLFRRCTTTDWIFQSMTMIRRNWQHYRDLYGIAETNYRNDYALSIALSLVNGSTAHVQSIPWSMATVLPTHKLSWHSVGSDDFWTIQYHDTNNKLREVSMWGVDFHAMGKRDLGDIVAGRTRLSDNSSQL